MKILHFADAHIDTFKSGVRDPNTGLPIRAMDFVRSLENIVESAITENVDAVLFSGDTYMNHISTPTYQKIWQRKIIELSNAGKLVVLLTGNHDITNSFATATAIQEFATLQIPNVILIDKPMVLFPGQLNGLPFQIIGLPYLSKSRIRNAVKGADNELIEFEMIIERLIDGFVAQLNPEIPTVVMGHFTIQGALFGSERRATFGNDFILHKSFFNNPAFDYVAMGHLHKYQDVNEGKYPPIVYSGSIERVDFGEAHDKKGFVILDLKRNSTTYEFREIAGRNFIDLSFEANNLDELTKILDQLPAKEEIKESVCRVKITHPEGIQEFIPHNELQNHFSGALSFKVVLNPIYQARERQTDFDSSRSMDDKYILGKYFDSIQIKKGEKSDLVELAEFLMSNPTHEEMEQYLDRRLEKKDEEKQTKEVKKTETKIKEKEPVNNDVLEPSANYKPVQLF